MYTFLIYFENPIQIAPKSVIKIATKSRIKFFPVSISLKYKILQIAAIHPGNIADIGYVIDADNFDVTWMRRLWAIIQSTPESIAGIVIFVFKLRLSLLKNVCHSCFFIALWNQKQTLLKHEQ